MNFKISLFLSLCTAILFVTIKTTTSSSSPIAATVATSSANVSKLSIAVITRSADMSLMQFMTQSHATTQQSPQRSLACFDYYVPVLNQIATDFETQYAACLQNAEMARDDLNGATQTVRTEIEERADSSCSSMANCNELQEAEAYFECYVYVVTENTKTMYSISADASQNSLYLREKLGVIENDQYRCSNDSKLEYQEKSTSLYEELQNCLSPASPPSTTTTLPIKTDSVQPEETILSTERSDVTTAKITDRPGEKMTTNV